MLKELAVGRNRLLKELTEGTFKTKHAEGDRLTILLGMVITLTILLGMVITWGGQQAPL